MTTKAEAKKAAAAEKRAAKAAAKQDKALEAAIDAQIAADAAAEEDAPKVTMAATLRKHRTKYQATVSYTNRASLNNGDDVASLMAGRSPEDVIAIAERFLGLDAGELTLRYGHLNPGQRRMNAGNRIRGAIKRGDKTATDLAKVV